MWPHVLVALIGAWLMASPAVLGFGRPAATIAWVAGPLVATFATISWWGATRPLRWCNAPAAACLLVAPMAVEHPTTAAVNSVACAVAVGALSALRGPIKHRFGGGWSAAWRRRAGARGAPAPRG